MAYSRIEQAYVDQLVQVQFPDPVEQEPTLLANANTGAPIASDAPTGSVTVQGYTEPKQVRVGRAGVPFKGPSMSDITEPAMGMLDMGAATVKGAAQGFVGLPGDLEGLGRLALNYMGVNVDEATALPTTAEVKKFFDEKLGPVGTGKNPYEGVGEIVAPGGQLKAVKPVGKVLQSGANALAPKAAEMTEGYLRSIGGIADIVPVGPKAINPATFKPQQEVKSAIEFVAADPVNSIYVPQAQRAPSVALRIARPEIVGTGKSNQITVEDVGTVLQKAQLSLYKNKPLDPTNIKDLTKMIDSASAEAEFQLAQPISGANWYDDDVANAFTMSAKVVPELATDEPLRVLTTAFAASTSYNKRAGENWAVATKITEHLLKTGKVPTRNPENGKLWGGTTGPIMEQQLKFHEFMLKKMGLADYTQWLLTPHTVKDIKSMKAESGLYKTIDIPGKATDMKMGSFVIGEKGGAFFLNLNGIKETTADKWFSRTYNRHAGSLTSGNISEQGLIDAPRNETERSIMKEWNRGVASNSKLDEQANQAVLWFYEQNLYYNLGVKSAKSESFSDGARNLLNARGVQFDESELIKSGSGGNALKATAESQGTTGTGNPIGLGQTAPVDGKPNGVKPRSKTSSKGVQ